MSLLPNYSSKKTQTVDRNIFVFTMDRLPAEILHNIFDSLDAETIFFSVRPVCRLFRSISQTYNRYNFDCRLISRPNFGVLLHFIPTEYIRTLALYNTKTIPNQFEAFFSLIRLQKLSRLQSLTLIGIAEAQFNYLLKRLNISLLRSFIVHIQHCDDRRRKKTNFNLLKIISQPTIRYIDINLLRRHRLKDIEWALECSVENLTINDGFIFETLSKIISCSPRLRKLTVKSFNASLIPVHPCKILFKQLESLIIDELDVRISEFQKFLLLTPSLRRLKFKNDLLFNSQEWEQFIQVNLPCLTQFEFYCSTYNFSTSQEDLRVLVESFQTPFWLEHKKWFITGNFDSLVTLFTIPNFEENSTTNTSSKDLCVYVRSNTTNDDIQKVVGSRTNITTLQIEFDRNIPANIIQLLEDNLILSNLVEIKVSGNFWSYLNSQSLYLMLTYLSNYQQLSKLEIESPHDPYRLYAYLEHICLLLPTQIKDLQILISDLKQLKIIVERCVQLRMLSLVIHNAKVRKEVRDWINNNTVGSICRCEHQIESIWVGKKIDQIDTSNKRFKTTGEVQIG